MGVRGWSYEAKGRRWSLHGRVKGGNDVETGPRRERENESGSGMRDKG